MLRDITFKKQGNGQDSWVIKYPNNHEMMPEMVFEDPNTIKKIDISKMDLNNLSDLDLANLKSLAQILKRFL